MGNQTIIERSFQILFIDLLVPYPRSKKRKSYLLLFLTNFQYVLLKHLRLARSNDIVDFLCSEVFNVYGVPETILSDIGALSETPYFSISFSLS